MDDTFTLFDNKEQAHKFLNYLNKQHPWPTVRRPDFTHFGDKK